VDEGSADVGFQAFELEEEVLVVEAERGGGGVDAWVGGDLLEAAQPMAFAFGGMPDVGGQVGMERLWTRWPAAPDGRPGMANRSRYLRSTVSGSTSRRRRGLSCGNACLAAWWSCY